MRTQNIEEPWKSDEISMTGAVAINVFLQNERF
jgi:hypothetical protein